MEAVCKEVEKLRDKKKFRDALDKIKEYNHVTAAESPQLWSLKANCLQRLNRFDEAHRAALEVFKVSSDTCELGVLVTLGEGYSRHDHYDKALDMYQRALDRCDTYRKSYCEIHKIEGDTECLKVEINMLQQKYDEVKRKCLRKAREVAIKPGKDEAVTKTLEAPVKAAQSSDSQIEGGHDEEKNIDWIGDSRSIEADDSKIEGGHDEEKNWICDPRSIEADLSTSSKYGIDTVQDGVYSGWKLIGHIGIKRLKSFVNCLDRQIEKYAELEDLGLKSVNILKIDDVACGSGAMEGSRYFVVEPVQTFQVYFSSERLQFFRNSQWKLSGFKSWSDDVKSDILSAWWKFIEVKFKKIFSEIVEGLLFVNSEDFRCGNLEFAVYFNMEGNARILPNMESKTSDGGDLVDLVRCMKAAAYQACPDSKVDLSCLPNDINHLFTFLTPEKLKYVPLRWLLNHHCFWSPQNRVRFVQNLNCLKARGLLVGISSVLGTVWSNAGVDTVWTSRIPKEGVLREIFQKGVTESSTSLQENIPSNYVKVKAYKHAVDIIRYMIAVYSHYNQSDYDEFRSEKLDEVQLERVLTDIFPNIYIHLVDAFYKFVKQVFKLSGQEAANVLLTTSTP